MAFRKLFPIIIYICYKSCINTLIWTITKFVIISIRTRWWGRKVVACRRDTSRRCKSLSACRRARTPQRERGLRRGRQSRAPPPGPWWVGETSPLWAADNTRQTNNVTLSDITGDVTPARNTVLQLDKSLTNVRHYRQNVVFVIYFGIWQIDIVYMFVRHIYYTYAYAHKNYMQIIMYLNIYKTFTFYHRVLRKIMKRYCSCDWEFYGHTPAHPAMRRVPLRDPSPEVHPCWETCHSGRTRLGWTDLQTGWQTHTARVERPADRVTDTHG